MAQHLDWVGTPPDSRQLNVYVFSGSRQVEAYCIRFGLSDPKNLNKIIK